VVIEDAWLRKAIVIMVAIAGAALWLRCRQSFWAFFLEDTDQEQRMRKRAIEVVLVLICAWVLLHWWAARSAYHR